MSVVPLPLWPPTVTCVADIVQLIQNQNIVALYADKIYHTFHQSDLPNLSDRTVIYISCKIEPDRINEWVLSLTYKFSSVQKLSKDNPFLSTVQKQNALHRYYIDLK